MCFSRKNVLAYDVIEIIHPWDDNVGEIAWISYDKNKLRRTLCTMMVAKRVFLCRRDWMIKGVNQ